MSDLKMVIDPSDPFNGDLMLDDDDLVLVDGKEAILQDCLQRLRFFFGEWFLDTTLGIPYFQQILVKNPDKSKIDAIFIDTILGTPGIEQLTSYSFAYDYTKRILTISFRAETTDGTVNYSGLLTS